MDARSSNSLAANVSPRPGRNWWKVGFILALLAFEVAREAAVLASAEKATPLVTAQVYTWGDNVTAQGTWTRIDGGDSLVPGTVKIECWRDSRRCLEASVMINKRRVFAPDLDWFDATFSPDSVTYQNDNPKCVKYSVRIDLQLKKAFAVRQRKDSVDPDCAYLENRIEMQITSGEAWTDPLRGHFVPLLQLLGAVLS